MLSALALLVLQAVTAQMESGDTVFSTSALYYGVRLIAALVIAILVPLLIDRHARSSRRVPR